MEVNNIFAIEPNSARRKLAKEMLNIDSIESWDNSLENSFDISIDAVGQDSQPEVLTNCLKSAKLNSKVLIFGIPTMYKQDLSIYLLLRKNLTIIGSINPDWSVYLPKGVKLAYENIELKHL